MKFIKKGLLTVYLIGLFQFSFAGEGMWLPLLLKALNEQEMQRMGMKMTAEDIYSVNKGSLKDAIVHFGGFCTGEIISANGLLLTNHHCGYGNIQSHSTLENNYLEDGFWAKTQRDELPNPGLTATFIVRIEDVSEIALRGISDDLDPAERQSRIDQNIEVIKEQTKLGMHEELVIKPFYKGNQYFAFVTMTYRDIRLVGAPPSSIGKFGADTDNWVWPRHTGDFSLFRIYAGPDNLPADFAANNQPLKPKHFLPISLDGVSEGDFTMVFGFPGRTNEYLPSPAVKQIMDVLDPAKISIRDRTLEIYNEAMRADPEVKIQYASKQSSIANAWKKWQGEILGLKKTNALKKKYDWENKFLKKVHANPNWEQPYGQLLGDFKLLYKDIEPFALTRDYYNEITGRNVEILRIAGNYGRLEGRYKNNGQTGLDAFKDRLKPWLESYYKNYRSEIDQKVFAVLMEKYIQDINGEYVPPMLTEWLSKYGNDYQKMAEAVYSQSFLSDAESAIGLLDMAAGDVMKALNNDPIIQLSKEWSALYDEKVGGKYNSLNGQIVEKQRIYMAALMEVFPKQRFYPDANSTMRVSYGLVEGFSPQDALHYGTTTYLDGIMEKYVPGDYEFDVPKKLIELYKKKDYGQYAEKNKIPVCFIGSNHTTGGNSGSPAIDAHGNLVGLNFDRVWEGTMSDINYDRSICRNIMVDARYILFIIDKYAGATRLIEEMKLVHPKLTSGKEVMKNRNPQRQKTAPRRMMTPEKLEKKKTVKTKD